MTVVAELFVAALQASTDDMEDRAHAAEWFQEFVIMRPATAASHFNEVQDIVDRRQRGTDVVSASEIQLTGRMWRQPIS